MTFLLTTEIVAILCGTAIFFSVVALFAIAHARNLQNRRNGSTWIFEGWQTLIYDTMFRNCPTTKVGRFIGMDVEKYMADCNLVRQEERSKVVIIDKFVGYLIIVIGCFIGIVFKNIYIMIGSLVFAFPFVTLPIHFAEAAANKRRFAIANELPRFLDMLHTALLIGLPVDKAIEITASNLKGTVLSEELLETLTDTQMGAYTWQEALEQLASRYGVDTFSDFVLDINNSYNLGASIQEAVARKSKEIKQTNLVAMKERAAKLTNTILVPVLLFKIIPIMALMLIPVITELNSSGF